MAVAVSKNFVKLILQAENGETSTGKVNHINRTYDNVNSELTNDDIYAAAKTISSLSNDVIDSIQKAVTSVLVENE